MDSEDVREAKRLVRTYSLEVAERLSSASDAHPLGEILRHNVDGLDRQDIEDPWRKFFEPVEIAKSDPISALISVEAAQLREKWVTFHSNCPKEDRLDLKKFDPTIDGVVDLVRESNAKWQTKRRKGGGGKFMSTFHSFCNTLDSHSALLKVLPEGNQYVSLFTGSLNAVIQASVNHERFAEGLADSLASISEHIIECKAELEIFHTPKVVEKVAELYAHVFLFLSSVMDFLMRKRFSKMLDSFNENIYKRFEDDIQKINAKASVVRDVAAQSSRAEVRSTREQLGRLDRDLRIGLQGDARHQAEMRDYATRIERELLKAQAERQELLEAGRQVKELTARLNFMLEEQGQASIVNQRAQLGSGTSRNMLAFPHQALFTAAPQTRSMPQIKVYSAEDVAQNSANLEAYFDRQRVRIECDHFNPVRVPRDTLSRLTEWSADAASQMLWIEGPPTEADGIDNPLSMLGATFIDLASQSRVPVMSYFCELLRRDQLRTDSDESATMQGVVALVSSLLRQMVELLLPIFETEIDLSAARFRLIDGTSESWADAMSMFRELAKLMPEKVFCVVDGLHWFDDGSVEPYLEELVQALRECKCIKVLWTTTGRSASLSDHISISETTQMRSLRSGTDGLYRDLFDVNT
ncbi:hypothetical protein EDB81DRAFT_726007 [Dactylonectria macrodidyma]|uniref:Uncharacterized protein n=1 Tax=Dactylonectria macrodidyma TaxID=307937 RepID=A0A9P9EB05_9HYPO|nr:hypothetical protein EDB81DRAFT_726007 [Dactylonectria macrodidyma]